MQKHEMDLSSQRLNFQTQQTADKGVIATLQAVIKDQYATIEKLQNDVMSEQSKTSPETFTQVESRVDDTEEAFNCAPEPPSSVNKLVRWVLSVDVL